MKISYSLIFQIIIFIILLLLAGLLFNYSKTLDETEVSNFLIDNNLSLLFLFLVSLIEGFLFFGIYFVGGVVMFLYVSYSTSVFDLFKIIIVIWVALIITSFLNYLVGYLYSKNNKSIEHFKFNTKKIKNLDNFNWYLVLFCFHTTSIAFLCFYLGYKQKSVLNIIGVVMIIFLVLVLYGSIIFLLFNKVL